MYVLNEEDVESSLKIESNDLSLSITSDDQQSWMSTFDRVFHSYQRYHELRRKDDAIKERFNDLQTKLQELDVFHQSPKEFCRTTTPSSRDSGIPVRSSSSCCSLTSESASTPKSAFELPFERATSQSPQTSVLHFFLHPPNSNRQRHVSVHLDEDTTGMAYVHDTIPRYQSHGRNVHWNDEESSQQVPRRSSSQHLFSDEHQPNYYSSDSSMIKTNGQRISLNASLPYDSKLNIRIHADRKQPDINNISQVKAIATIEPLDNPHYEQEYYDSLRKNYLEHYSTISPNEDLQTTMTSAVQQQREKLPRHRQVSLPVSLPVDQRIYLYIQNGEVLARC